MACAVSTSWNAFRHTDGTALVSELKALGFEEIELSFNLTPAIVGQIQGLAEQQLIRVTSVHNFCPIPDGVLPQHALPDHFSVASLDEEQRRAAVAQTKVSIDTVKRLGGRAVVMHCGRVELLDETRELIALFNGIGPLAEGYLQLKEALIRRRAESAGKHMQSLLRSLDELNSYAAVRGIKLGLETRYYYCELPLPDELQEVFRRFGPESQIGYWHDAGHARCLQNMGFISSDQEFLRRFGPRLLGMHVHDIKGVNDHQAVGEGEIDFKSLAAWRPRQCIDVIEVHRSASSQQLQRSRQILEGLGYGR